jgi:hypothetical protein
MRGLLLHGNCRCTSIVPLLSWRRTMSHTLTPEHGDEVLVATGPLPVRFRNIAVDDTDDELAFAEHG